MKLEFKSLQEKVEFLRKADRDYRDGNSIVPDDVYDYLEREVRQEDPDNEFLRQIEDDSFGLERKLTIHMGSQDKAKNLEEMNRFYNRIDISELLSVSEKMDGMSAELTYEGGFLMLALTRGDGEYGVDITSMVRGAKDIPLFISNQPKMLVVRGEIIITRKDLESLNKELIRDERDPYQNPRNGVVGLVKTLKNRKYAKYLSFRAFDVLGVN